MEKGDAIYQSILKHSSIKENGSIRMLQYLLKHFPLFFTLTESDGSIELSYNTKSVSMDITAATPYFEIRAWERGLKHAGMELVQKHPNTIKKWRV